MIPYFTGFAYFQSELSLEEAAKIISDRILGGAKFGGADEDIHEEIPAVYVSETILGFNIVLDGYSGFLPEQRFELSIVQNNSTIEGAIRIDMSAHLEKALAMGLKDISEIKLLPG